MRILVLSLILSNLGPMLRFYRNPYFYFFLLTAITDASVYFFVSILGFSTWSINIYLLSNLLIFVSLPDLKYRYKFLVVLFLLIFSLADRSEITAFIVIIFTMLFTLLYFINLFFQKISKERKILLFVIPIIVLYSVGITLMYFYYAKPSIIISTIIYKISLYISSNLLVTLWGPNKAISIEKYFPFPSPNFFKELSIQNLTELELTQREIEIYQLLKKGLKNSQIGENLFIDRRTVESHLFHIKIKLGFKTVTELRKHIKVTTPQKNFNKQSE